MEQLERRRILEHLTRLPDALRQRILVDSLGCWRWTSHRDRNGYAIFGKKRKFAHRLAYEAAVGPIPEGLTIDHLCRVRDCLNPAHMEPVTRGENVLRGDGITARNARKTHCHRGHPLNGENLDLCEPGHRRCRQCRRDRDRNRRMAA